MPERSKQAMLVLEAQPDSSRCAPAGSAHSCGFPETSYDAMIQAGDV